MIKVGRSILYGIARESISQYFFQRGSWTKALCIMWQLETRQISYYFHHRVIGNFLIFCIIADFKADQRVSFINLLRNCVFIYIFFFNFNILQFEYVSMTVRFDDLFLRNSTEFDLISSCDHTNFTRHLSAHLYALHKDKYLYFSFTIIIHSLSFIFCNLSAFIFIPCSPGQSLIIWYGGCTVHLVLGWYGVF